MTDHAPDETSESDAVDESGPPEEVGDPISTGRWGDRLFETHDPECAYDGQSGAALEAWQTETRERLRSVLGLDRIEGDGPVDPDPRRRGTADVDDETSDATPTSPDRRSEGGHERQTWDLRTESGLRVPFYLILPEEPDPPYPTVLALHGHAEAGKDLAAGLVDGDAHEQFVGQEERDFARQAVERGYAAVVPDMRGFGDLEPPEDPRAGGTCRTLQVHAQLVGRSLVGDRVWDALRLAEFVRDRPDLDDDRLAVVGHSGGGAVALFAAALDDELGPAVVSSYFCALADSIVAVDHCTCNYVPGLAQVGHVWDVAGLLAPRPVRFLAGRDDDIFPVEGVERAFRNLRPMYEAAGAPEAADLVVADGGHRFFEAAAWPFVDRHC